MRLVPVDEGWTTIARELAADISTVLADVAAAVEHVGSTAVPGLLAKPIIDLAIAVPTGTAVDDLTEPLSQLGWMYRGDAGDDGGWVFVLEDSPWHRVAHAHGVEFGGRQWVRYLQFRDLLRRSADARRTYEAIKQQLAQQHPNGRHHYTAGKDATVEQLLAANP
ncbi:MAG: GrpB family protein [Acidimicrobiales bacterium]